MIFKFGLELKKLHKHEFKFDCLLFSNPGMRRNTARAVVSSTALQPCSQEQQSRGKEGGGRGKGRGKRKREEGKPDTQDSLPSPKRNDS